MYHSLTRTAEADDPERLLRSFHRKNVAIPPGVVESAQASCGYLLKQLLRLAENDPEFPRCTGEWMMFGSLARGVKTVPLDDIDLMLVLNGAGSLENFSIFDRHKFLLTCPNQWAYLSQFQSDYGFVNSTTILHQIRDCLADIPSYSKAEVHKNMQAVVLDLSSYSWSFDVVPAVPITYDFRTVSHYLIPDGHGGWERTDPRRDHRKTRSALRQHGLELLSVLQMLRYWNERGGKPKLPSYYFENIALDTLGGFGAITDWVPALSRFFSHGRNTLIQPMPDPKGLGADLDESVDLLAKIKVMMAMEKIDSSLSVGQFLAQLGMPERATECWKPVFGEELFNNAA